MEIQMKICTTNCESHKYWLVDKVVPISVYWREKYGLEVAALMYALEHLKFIS